MTIMVEKREGHLEPLNLDKIHKVLNWAAENLVGVSVSEVELKSQLQFFDNIKTEDIHETLIKTAADLISERTTDYQYMAARLAIFHLRKKAYKGFTPPHIYEHVVKMVDKGLYDKEVAKRLVKHVFSVGNSVDPEVAYPLFRGKKSTTDALMRARNFPIK